MTGKTKRKKAASKLVAFLVYGERAEQCASSLREQYDGPGDVAVATNLEDALKRSKKNSPCLVVRAESVAADDLSVDRQRWSAVDPALPVLLCMVPGEDDVRRVADAFRVGFDDVFIDDLSESAKSWIARRATRAEGSLFPDRAGMPKFLGRAPEMVKLASLVERVADTDATVLILGESGTGKELVARAMHVFSKRHKGPFVAINCAAIPDTLLENELFGHEKGAYTGASSTAIGKVEAADKGTLFLDEIGEMPIALQAKILRLLQDKTYDRIGGTKTRKADIRIVTATNRDLRAESVAGRFREDLYFRLSVVPMSLPALRERAEDLPLLANAILEKICSKMNRPRLALTDGASERLQTYRWPGNVRELENELERAAVMASGDSIGAEDLELRTRVEDPEHQLLARKIPLEGSLEAARAAGAEMAGKLRVAVALESAGGDRDQAAQALGIARDELDREIEKLGGGEG